MRFTVDEYPADDNVVAASSRFQDRVAARSASPTETTLSNASIARSPWACAWISISWSASSSTCNGQPSSRRFSLRCSYFSGWCCRSRAGFKTRFRPRNNAAALLDSVFCLRSGLRLPLHVARCIGAAVLQCSHVVDHVAGTSSRGSTGRRARMRFLELRSGPAAPGNFSVGVPCDPRSRAARVVAASAFGITGA